jgi:Cupin-like domain
VVTGACGAHDPEPDVPEPIAAIREYASLNAQTFHREVVAGGRPAVLRGQVAGWPAVTRARTPSGLVEYLRGFDNGGLVDGVMTPPEVDGQIFYNAAMDGFNFVRNRLPLSAIAEQVLRYAAFPRPPAVAAQSALIRDCVPGFATENRLALVEDSVLPRIWLGNAVTTPTHVDEWCNVACVVAGRRRFTLFPPEQVGNLYVGPLDFAPTGAPMSLVRLREPDFERFPRFRAALAAAQSAELGPGDALYIPPLWWHNVESLASCNLLVNYWWHAATGGQGQVESAFDCLMHCIVGMRHLPPPAREAWRALFEHYVFGPREDVVAHIPAARRGILGELGPTDVARLRAALARRLERPPQ